MSAEYKAGDKITLEHADGSKLVNREVYEAIGGMAVPFILRGMTWGQPIATLIKEGWSVTAHVPNVTLPTEPSYYLDREKDAWLLDWSGKWKNIDAALSGAGMGLCKDTELYAPFTRLEPVPETAARVIARMVESLDVLGGAAFVKRVGKEIAAEFGVTE